MSKSTETEEVLGKLIAHFILLFIYSYILQWTWNTVVVDDFGVTTTDGVPIAELEYLHTVAICLSLNALGYLTGIKKYENS
jgi:hypothetical protein